MTKETYRRRAGFILGGIVGLVLGAVSQVGNAILLPDLSLYQPPFGMLINLVLTIAAAAVLGLICCWSSESISGVLLSAAIAAALLLGASVIGGRLPILLATATVLGVIFLWLPFTAMAALITWIIRSAVNRLTETRGENPWHPGHWVLACAVVLAAGGVGAALLMPSDGRMVLTRMEALIRQGQAASSSETIPAPLTGRGVDDFRSHADGAYSLAWERKSLTRYAIPRPAGPEYLMSAAIARFDNGWNLVCLYPNVEAEPRCRSFDVLP